MYYDERKKITNSIHHILATKTLTIWDTPIVISLVVPYKLTRILNIHQDRLNHLF